MLGRITAGLRGTPSIDAMCEIGSCKPTYRERSGCAENVVCCPFLLEARSYSHAPRQVSQLGSMCECGRRTSRWIGLTPKVHGCDKTGVHSEYVENFAVR